MAKVVGKIPLEGTKALEIAMQDTMDGMSDLALYFAYRSSPETVQILSIEPPKPVNFSHSPAQIVRVKSSQHVTGYPIQRKLHLKRLPI